VIVAHTKPLRSDAFSFYEPIKQVLPFRSFVPVRLSYPHLHLCPITILIALLCRPNALCKTSSHLAPGRSRLGSTRTHTSLHSSPLTGGRLLRAPTAEQLMISTLRCSLNSPYVLETNPTRRSRPGKGFVESLESRRHRVLHSARRYVFICWRCGKILTDWVGGETHACQLGGRDGGRGEHQAVSEQG